MCLLNGVWGGMCWIECIACSRRANCWDANRRPHTG